MTMIRPETEMKDSGIQWLGNIPKEWSIIKGKYILKQLSRSVLESDNVVTCFRDGEVTLRSNRRELGFTNSLKEIGYQGVEPGDLVVHGMDGFAGAIGISDSRGKMSPIINVLESGECKKYLMYYLRGLAFVNVFLGLSTGIRERSCDLRWNKLANLEYTIPPLSEQQAIANYLDETCSKIDEIIAEAKASIDEYKELKQSVLCDTVLRGLNSQIALKNSGASWIGMIPEHWKTVKLKWHLRRMDPKNPGEKEVLSLYRDYGVIPKNSRNDNHNVTSEDTSKYKYVRVGDFVVNKMKAWQGSVAVSDYEGIVSPAYYVYHFLDDVFNKRYFHHLLRSCYKEEFMRLSGGIRIGQWDLSSNALDNIILLVPPKNEQDDIVEYLDNKLPQIDALIAEKESLINDLEAYKKSLIYEVVTGKRRVV